MKITVHPDYKHLEEFIRSIPARFDAGEGVVIYKGRNELRTMKHEEVSYVVKSFCRPNFPNRFIYGLLRGSKAKRSYDYAERFLQIGVGTPQPVAYMEQRKGLLFDKSFYVSLLSDCPHIYYELFEQKFACEDAVMREIGRLTAILHEHGYAHKDYGRGNILFRENPDGTVKLDIVDLNRMELGHIDMKKGCKNLERLPATPHMHRLIAEEYARLRGFDAGQCFKLMQEYRSTQPGKIDNLY